MTLYTHIDTTRVVFGTTLIPCTFVHTLSSFYMACCMSAETICSLSRFVPAANWWWDTINKQLCLSCYLSISIYHLFIVGTNVIWHEHDSLLIYFKEINFSRAKNPSFNYTCSRSTRFFSLPVRMVRSGLFFQFLKHFIKKKKEQHFYS